MFVVFYSGGGGGFGIMKSGNPKQCPSSRLGGMQVILAPRGTTARYKYFEHLMGVLLLSLLPGWMVCVRGAAYSRRQTRLKRAGTLVLSYAVLGEVYIQTAETAVARRTFFSCVLFFVPERHCCGEAYIPSNMSSGLVFPCYPCAIYFRFSPP